MSEQILVIVVGIVGIAGFVFLTMRAGGMSASFFRRERTFRREIEELVDQSIDTVVEYVRLQNKRR